MTATREQDDNPRRDDLIDAVAIMVHLPPYREGEEDRREGLSLGGVFANYGDGPDSPEGALAREFLDAVVQIVDKATAGLPDKLPSSDIRAREYKVGPAASGIPEYIVIAARDIYPALSVASTLLTLGQAAAICLRKFPELVSRLKVSYRYKSSPLVFTEPMLRGLCYLHLIETYAPERVDQIQSQTRSSIIGYGSAHHPAYFVRYVFRMDCGSRTYFYTVRSDAVFEEHFSIEGEQMMLHSLPCFGDDEYHAADDIEQVRTLGIERNAEMS
jgi:hypothetical protein